MMNNSNFAVLSYDFYPFEGGQGRNIYSTYYQFLKLKKQKKIIFINPCQNDLDSNFSFFTFTKKLGKNISFSFFINFILERIIKTKRITTLNIHAGPGGVFLLRKVSAKVIVTAHHTYYQQASLVPGQGWKKILVPFEKYTYQLADKIIADTNSTKRVLVEKYKIDAKKIKVIPLFIDTDQFKIDQKIKKIPNSLLFVGRLDQRKGIDWLIESFKKLSHTIPESCLYIVGDGELKEQIETFIDENSLQSKIKLLGKVSDPELIKWYNRAEILVIPSIFEGFGLVALEAMACGMAVVATASDGLSDVMSDYKNNLVPYSDSKALVKTIKRVFLENHAHQRGTKLAQDQITKQCSLQHNYKRVLKVYDLAE